MKKNHNLKKRKKMLYDVMCCKEYTPMRAKDMAVLLQIPAGKREELHKTLDALLEEGKITVNKRGRYEAVREEKRKDAKKSGKKERIEEKREKKEKRGKNKREEAYLTGTFISNPKGFGFVEIEDEETDIYIPEEKTCGAFYKDLVQIQVVKEEREGHRREGKVVKILEHTVTSVVGTVEKSDSFGFLIPDNRKITKDIFIPIECMKNAVTGDKAIAQIKKYGSSKRNPEGKIIEILGHEGEKGVDVLSVAKSYELPMEFPEKVMNQAEKIKTELNEGDFFGRMDLRDWSMVTIDGEDAKDLDDAVSLTKEGEFYRLGVHIADVSNYVQYNSALDREALKRGTSVYLVDRVIPMLPKKLSNGICSLNAGEDRLALSCLMDIDKKGNVVGHKIAETVIHVTERMTYTNVNKILTHADESVTKKYQEFVPMFFLMKELSEIIRKNRRKRGAIDFDFPESKVILDENGKPVDIYEYEHNSATDLIEDFMLLANETVAEEYYFNEIPFVYRTHEEPDPEKIESAFSMIRAGKIKVKKAKENVSPKEIQQVLKEIEGLECEPFFARLLLRSMKQAKYTTDCIGHFGLAARYYCHFTSPIRRYPDLQIHRIIKENLRSRMTKEKKQHYKEILPDVASRSSMLERRAEEVERETVKMKKAEYMMAHIGEEFEGIISGVTEWGFYVELSNTIEGLVHVNLLTDDYYEYDREHYTLTGEDTGKVYKMGQKIRVKVLKADLATRTVDFLPAKEKTAVFSYLDEE